MRSAAHLLLLLLAAAVAVGGAPGEAGDSDDARKLFLARCSSCHDPSRVYHRIASLDEWREIVFRMQRMPQSGIAPEEAEAILEYLARRMPGKDVPRAATAGGRDAWGEEWISILETAPVADGEVRISGRRYAAVVGEGGRRVSLLRDGKTRVVSLEEDGSPGKTALVRRWRVGRSVYEVHLVLYEVRDGEPRVGRALRKRA